MAVLRDTCSAAPRSKSETVLRLTPSLRANSAWEILTRRRPRATRRPSSKGFRRRSAPNGMSVMAVNYSTHQEGILAVSGPKWEL
jgi:hypothetical protein